MFDPLWQAYYTRAIKNPNKHLQRKPLVSSAGQPLDGFPASENFSQLIADRNRFERLSRGRKFWKAERKPGDEDNRSQFRKGISGDWKNHFKNSHRDCFKELAGESLIKFGYEQDMSW